MYKEFLTSAKGSPLRLAAAILVVSLAVIGAVLALIARATQGMGDAPDESVLFSSWCGMMSMCAALVFAGFGIWSSCASRLFLADDGDTADARRQTVLGAFLWNATIGAAAFAVVSAIALPLMGALGGVAAASWATTAGAICANALLVGASASALGIGCACLGEPKRMRTAVIASVVVVCCLSNTLVIEPELLTVLLAFYLLALGAIGALLVKFSKTGKEVFAR